MKSQSKSLIQYEYSKWDEDLLFLREALVETLNDLGMEELGKILPWGEFDLSSKTISLPLSERAIQVFSICFHLLNMVEENTANQIRRDRGYAGEGLWEDAFELCKSNSLSHTEIQDLFSKIYLEPVLTAHPTEAKRATVLEHHRRLYLLLVKTENRMWSKLERDTIREEIKSLLECLLRTGDLYLERPEVSDELRNITYYLKSTLPLALRALHKRFIQSWEQSYPDEAKNNNYPVFPELRFGTWVGGDRDGHPFVNSEVTRETLLTLRNIALDQCSELLTNLVKILSLNDRLQKFPLILEKRTNELKELLGEDISKISLDRNPGEPWRQYLNLLIHRIPPKDKTPEYFHYKAPSELINDLMLLSTGLIEIGAKRLSLREVEPVIILIKSFGFHLATLDIRQNSAFHDKAISQLIKAAGFDDYNFQDWDIDKRISFLNSELKSKRPFVQGSVSVSNEGDEVRKTFKVLKEHGENFGFQGIGSLIVSMTRDLSDLLSVYILAKESELATFINETVSCPIPVVPLFETIDDLKNSFKVVEDFIRHPVSINSKNHLVSNNDSKRTYQIMIGYSDSSKDGGVLSSYLNLYNTQDKLTKIGEMAGVNFIFFHGRGGTISRGAGPTGRFLSALPPGSFENGLRMTEQGETISQKYANLLTASYNLELLHAGTIIHGLSNSKVNNSKFNEREKELFSATEFLSNESQISYQSLISHKYFINFFREATPIDVIEHSRFGSRPPKRTGASSLEDLRAIPWVFSWNQSRFFLSSWYGVGIALDKLRNEEPSLYKLLKSEIYNFAPANYIITNIESSIYSASIFFMKEYSELVEDKNIKDTILSLILSEYELCIKTINELFKKEFELRRPRLHRTLKYREAPLHVLHLTQIKLLKEWRISKNEDTLTELLLVTNAIAGGLRTTG